MWDWSSKRVKTDTQLPSRTRDMRRALLPVAENPDAVWRLRCFPAALYIGWVGYVLGRSMSVSTEQLFHCDQFYRRRFHANYYCNPLYQRGRGGRQANTPNDLLQITVAVVAIVSVLECAHERGHVIDKWKGWGTIRMQIQYGRLCMRGLHTPGWGLGR